MTKALSFAGLVLLAAALLAGCGQASPATAPAATPAGEPIRVAILYPDRVDDMGFNRMLYEGMVAMQEDLGDGVEVAYTEGLYEVVDIEPALRDYAAQGYDLIIGHGFQFQDPIMAVAPLYPDLVFAIGPGAYMTADNVVLYDVDNEQTGYCMGYVAALMTESNIIGSVGGVDVPNIHAMHASLKTAIQEANQDAQVPEVWTGSFIDVEASREAALSLIDQGADVIHCDTACTGALEAARERGVYMVSGYNMSALAPEVFLASMGYEYEVALEQMVSDVRADSLSGDKYELTLQNGGLALNIHLEDEAEPVRDQIDSMLQGVIDGTIEIPEVTFE